MAVDFSPGYVIFFLEMTRTVFFLAVAWPHQEQDEQVCAWKVVCSIMAAASADAFSVAVAVL